MQIELIPEVLDAPLGYGVFTHAQIKEAAEAMLKSADYLETFGDPSKPTPEDKQTARDVLLTNNLYLPYKTLRLPNTCEPFCLNTTWKW
jgi:hypothetical protein